MRNELPPEFLALYEPQKCFSHNAISETYLVKSLKDGKEYVAKVYDKFFIKGTDEGAILQDLNHPGIPKLIESIKTDDMICVVREYVEGVSLENLALPISESGLLRIATQLCDILTYLHTRKVPIIHRDIKPSNIIINSENRISLIDFDISREYDNEAVRDTTLMATDGFSSPEQYGFGQTDALSDIYSFGRLMCWLLTGSSDVSAHSVTRSIKNNALANVIKKCAAFSPKERYKSSTAVKAALFRACKNGDGNRKRASVSIATLGILLAVAFAGGFAIGRLTVPEIEQVQEEIPLYLQEYTFVEPLIEESVGILLNKRNEPITYGDLEEIEELYMWGNIVLDSGLWLEYDFVSNGNIANLEDLQYMPNLQKLILLKQPLLTDLSPLAKLSKLENLAIVYTDVDDFSPLTNDSLKMVVVDEENTYNYNETMPYIEGLPTVFLPQNYDVTYWYWFWGMKYPPEPHVIPG